MKILDGEAIYTDLSNIIHHLYKGLKLEDWALRGAAIALLLKQHQQKCLYHLVSGVNKTKNKQACLSPTRFTYSNVCLQQET